ncbi:MAG TPA: hypothetical protein VJ753_02325 [Rhizomicrobium sp.]|nr:hypothetical protein [Rhizomicrobium sp.]HKY18889.1 hypothetical protein [Rhizomicrobium sp.]
MFLRYGFWNPERKLRIAARTAQLVKGGKSALKAEKAAKETFKRSLKFALFYKPEDYAAILKTMNAIKRFQFDVSTVIAQQRVFSPDIDLRRVQETVSFEKPDSVDDITDAISSFVKKKKIGRGKVVAIDADGEYQTIHLAQNIEGFGEFDFDETTANLETDVEDFAKSPVIKNLLKTARNNKDLFF